MAGDQCVMMNLLFKQDPEKQGENGYCDKDLRMTPRGRAYLRMKSLNMRIGNPREAAEPLPQPSTNSEIIILKYIDLTVDDGASFYGV